VTIYVCRDGQDIGSWPEDEFRDRISRGQILPSDYFYHEGMNNWSLVSTYNPSDQDESAKTAEATEPKPHHDWRLDCATEKQINYLASFGVAAQPGLTKGEASDLIEQCANDPEALARQNQIRQVRYEEETRERAAFPSYYLKADIVRASRDLEETKDRHDKTKKEISTKTKGLTAAEKKLGQAVNDDDKADIQRKIDDIKADLENAQSEFVDFPGELEDAQTELKDARSDRIGFWKATFKEDWILSDEESRLIDFADTIDSLYARYGRYFKIPTNKMVIDILEALDKASPDWDKREPHAFYEALKTTVPDCTRKNVKAVTSSRGQGCLILFAGIVSLVLYLVITHWRS
jgi:hypothetical protein